MAKNYNDINYFETRTDIVKIFDDLESFHNFCRMELIEFNEAHLYNRESWQWRNYEKSTRPRKPWNGEKKQWSGERKPYQGNKPRYNQ
jgi:hypothetical protein